MRPASEGIQHGLRRKPTDSGSAEDYEAFFRRVLPGVAIARRISGDRPSAEDATLEALAKGPRPLAQDWRCDLERGVGDEGDGKRGDPPPAPPWPLAPQPPALADARMPSCSA
jgi:hypothetical protein